jgi:hypothetical protein
MRMLTVGIVISAVSFLAPTSLAQDEPDLDNGQSTFVAPDKAVMFGFTVPADSNLDVFVTMRVKLGLQWGAIGLGADGMADDRHTSLVFVLYLAANGTGVTFSPRISRGHYEPEYFPDVQYQVLPGTGVVNGSLVFSMRCTAGCRNWMGGYIDVTDANQKAIFAVGPGGDMFTDDVRAPLSYHEDYGKFRINMQRTGGAADAPALDDNSESEGTVLVDGSYNIGKSDRKATAHGLLMIFCFIGLFPLGVLILRIGDWVRWHALNQALALILVGVAGGVGIADSLYYQRVSLISAG